MKDEEGMDDLLGRALREIDAPPPAPREEMWVRIQTQRASGPVLEPGPRRNRIWIPWSAAIAATLILGFGLGRISLKSSPADTIAGEVAAPQSDANPPGSDPAGAIPIAYRLAATNHMARTETLLASLAVNDGTGGTREMSGWARELLTDTRLLLSSPAAQDAATRTLLEDLELILAQVAGIPEARAEEEVKLIHEGINQSDVLLRLRAATAGPRLVGT